MRGDFDTSRDFCRYLGSDNGAGGSKDGGDEPIGGFAYAGPSAGRTSCPTGAPNADAYLTGARVPTVRHARRRPCVRQ